MSNKLRTDASSKALPLASGIISDTKFSSVTNPSLIAQPISNAVRDLDTENIMCGVEDEQY